MADDNRPRAVVLGVQFPNVSDEEHHASLEELERLAKTLGLNPVARVTQKRGNLANVSVVGRGKLQQLAALTGGIGEVPTSAFQKLERKDHVELDVEENAAGLAALSPEQERVLEEGIVPMVLVDHDVSASQLRSLEKATGAEVLDRSSVILAIFHRHARTREAKLQVEIARLVYTAPRLRETNAGGDRQRGGVGGKGAGESALELDRRKIRDRIAELREELSLVQREAGTRRKRRQAENTVALVGYTNAGKSSLMRALTGSEPYVANKLFATLDTTVRTLDPPTRPPMLVSDTVGFIKKLPHDLVASFRSTLEEAHDADILLHVVDASDPVHESHMEVTRSVLGEIGVTEATELLVLNKSDRLSAEKQRELREKHPDAVLMSAHDAAQVAQLHAQLVELSERNMVEAEVFVPYTEQRRVYEIHESARVIAEKHEETGTKIVFIAPEAVVKSVLRGGSSRL